MRNPFRLTGLPVCTASRRVILPIRPRHQHLFSPQTSRPLSATSTRSAIAAPEIAFPDEELGDPLNPEAPKESNEPSWARVVPASPSYFTAKPNFTDNLLFLRRLLAKFIDLPVVKPGQAPRVAWRTLSEYRTIVGEPTKSSKYHRILDVLHRLNRIEQSCMPHEVKLVLQQYKRDIDPFLNKAKPIPVDRFGRTLGVGKRKSSTARAWVVEGTGEVLVNGKNLAEFFGRVHDRETAIWALKATERIDKYNIWALCRGGGTTGQAEALALAVSKALMAHEPLLKPALRRAGVVTRDPRRVERKKPGHLKARKMPAWVKR